MEFPPVARFLQLQAYDTAKILAGGTEVWRNLPDSLSLEVRLARETTCLHTAVHLASFPASAIVMGGLRLKHPLTDGTSHSLSVHTCI